jgi:putative peptidoglycan lipid II flippase
MLQSGDFFTVFSAPMTFLLALSSLLSRLLGVFRNHALADSFGATELSDAYFAAFQVPDTLYRLLVFGAISASFVPLFLGLQKKDPQKAQEFVSSVMNGFLIFITVISIVVFFFAEPFVEQLYPAFTAENQQQTVELLRIMLLSPLFFTCSSLFAGIQNAFRTFWGYALAPIVYNIGIIFGILFLAPTYGINGVAYGVVLGAFFHAAVQLFPALKLGFTWRPTLHWSPEFKKLLITAIPRILSMASFQVNFFIEGVIATLLFAGNLTVLRYAQDIQSFPIGIIGISIAVASFSILSHFVIDEEHLKLSAYLRDKLDHLFLLMIPAAFGLYVLRTPIVKLILEGGVFDAEAVMLTSNTLAYLCIGLVAAAVMPLVTRVFFAFHDTIRPFYVMLVTVIANTILAWYLSQSMGVIGIGLSSSITSTISVILLIWILTKKYLKGHSFFPVKNTAIFLVGASVMTFLLTHISNSFTYSEGTLMLIGQIILMTALGAVIYAAVVFIFLRNRLFELLRTLGK